MHSHRTHAQHLKALREMSDEDLMDQFQAGAVQAFEILVERFSERLKNYVYRFVADSALSEDMVQETFLRVYRNRHSYQRIARFSTWIFTIAGNVARSEYRTRKRHRLCPLQRTSRDEEVYDLQLPDSASSPEEVAEMALQRTFLEEALEKLPENYREVVVLRDIQQLSYEEVAEITGAPVGTVKSRINRGRSQLRNLLGDVYPFEASASRSEHAAQEQKEAEPRRRFLQPESEHVALRASHRIPPAARTAA